jgi:molybdenum cofactor guanylyltransferase
LIERVVSRLRPQVGTIVVSANRNHEHYRRLDVEVVPDWTPGFAGPLAGLIAAWARCETPWVLVVPVDAPCVANHLALNLIATALRHPHSLAIVAHDGFRTQPLFCFLHSRARTDMLAYWDEGGRSVDTWLRRVGAVESPVIDVPDCFRNMNQLEDFVGDDGANL